MWSLANMKHYLIIGGKLQDEDKHNKSIIPIMRENNINEMIVIITGLFRLVCSQFSNDNYALEGGDKVVRIVNKISDTSISYIEIKEVTI